MTRPSDREIINKIYHATKAIEDRKRSIAEYINFVSDQYDLGIGETEDLWPLLLIFLEEIKLVGPINCYIGKRPPESSYSKGIKGLELWVYCWDSKSMNKKMYLKFCIKKDNFFYVSCHESKKEGRRL